MVSSYLHHLVSRNRSDVKAYSIPENVYLPIDYITLTNESTEFYISVESETSMLEVAIRNNSSDSIVLTSETIEVLNSDTFNISD